jgi:Tfp pilus assembly protein PilO
MTEMRKWSLGAVAVVLVALLAGWFLLISPKRSEAADLQAKTQTQLDANAQLQNQITLLKQQAKDLPEKQAQLAALDTKIPAEASLPGLIRQLTTAAQKSGVELTEITPSVPAPLVTTPTDTTVVVPATTNLLAINLSLSATGGYFELQQFFSQLERMDRALLVTGATVAEQEDTTSGDTTATTTSTGPTPLVATITSQVFVSSDTPIATTPGATSAETTTPTE